MIHKFFVFFERGFVQHTRCESIRQHDTKYYRIVVPELSHLENVVPISYGASFGACLD